MGTCKHCALELAVRTSGVQSHEDDLGVQSKAAGQREQLREGLANTELFHQHQLCERQEEARSHKWLEPFSCENDSRGEFEVKNGGHELIVGVRMCSHRAADQKHNMSILEDCRVGRKNRNEHLRNNGKRVKCKRNQKDSHEKRP